MLSVYDRWQNKADKIYGIDNRNVVANGSDDTSDDHDNTVVSDKIILITIVRDGTNAVGNGGDNKSDNDPHYHWNRPFPLGYHYY